MRHGIASMAASHVVRIGCRVCRMCDSQDVRHRSIDASNRMAWQQHKSSRLYVPAATAAVTAPAV